MNYLRICPNCGYDDLDKDDVFCADCGYNLKIHIKPKLTPDLSDTKLHLNSDIVERYKEISSELVQLDKIELKLNQQKQYFDQVKHEYNQAQERVQRAKQITQKEFQDVEKLKNLTWKSFIASVKGDKEAKLEKEEAEYFQAVNQEQAAIQHLEEVQMRYKVVEQQFTQIKDMVDHKNRLTQELQKIVDRACEGVADPIEDPIEIRLETLLQKREPLYNKRINLKNARSHFQNAINHLRRCQSKLNDAKGMSDWDTFFGGGFIVDSMKHSHMSDARAEIQQTLHSLKLGYQIVPDAPQVSLPEVGQGNFIWDTLFDNFFSDMRVREQIRRSQYEVQESLQETQNVIQWLEGKLAVIEQEYTGLKTEIDQTREKLTQERIRMLEEAIA